jgi:hypothetical protein
MKWLKGALLAIAVVGVPPAAADPVTPDRPGNELVRDPVETADSEAAAFGRWLQQVTVIEAPIQQQMLGLRGAFAEAQAAGGSAETQAGRLRAYVERALTVVDAADAEMAAVELPRLAVLELPADVRPAALVIQIRRLNRDIRAMFASFLPLIGATSQREAEAAAAGAISSLQLVFESQIVLMRAHQAVTPREYLDWELISFELGYLRAGLRVFEGYRPFEPQVDERLPADLSAIADELDANLQSARAKYAAELAEQEEALAEATRQADQASVTLLRRSGNVFRISQDYFPLIERLSVHLRSSVSLVRGRPMTEDLLSRVFAPMREIRQGLDDIGRRQARALADTPTE